MKSLTKTLWILVSLLSLNSWATCESQPKVKEYIENNSVLQKLEAALELTYSAQPQFLCQWNKKRDDRIISQRVLEIPFMDRIEQCVATKRLVDVYLDELNQGLPNCNTDSCQKAKNIIDSLDFIYTMHDQFKQIEEGSSFHVDIIDPQSKLTQLVFTRKALDGICGQAEVTLLAQEDPKDGINYNNSLNSELDKILLPLKQQPNFANDALRALFDDNEFEYLFKEQIEYENDLYFSYSQTLFHFSGGAHPNTFIKYITLDKNTGEKLKLSQVLDPKYKAVILKTAKTNLLSNYQNNFNLDPNKSLQENGFWFAQDDNKQEKGLWTDDSGFYLPENFIVVSDGIVFLYNPYEIAPYSMGAPTIHIDWSELDDE